MNRRLIDQLHIRAGAGHKLTRYLHTHRILKSCITIKALQLLPVLIEAAQNSFKEHLVNMSVPTFVKARYIRSNISA